MAVESHDKLSSTESQDERLARNVSELLQELRVAQAGVQFLFGFLLAVAFTEHYARASGFEQVVHLIAVVFATASVALLTAPAAWHRLLFRQGQRSQIVQVANIMMVTGLVCLAVAMTATVLLLFKVVAGTVLATVVAVLVGAMFAALWFLLPLRTRRNGNGGDEEDDQL